MLTKSLLLQLLYRSTAPQFQITTAVEQVKHLFLFVVLQTKFSEVAWYCSSVDLIT